MKRPDLNKLSKEIHNNNVSVGWWDVDEDGNEPCIYEKLQLVSTEVAEATEGERKNLMDDKLTHRKMAEVELADTLIRVLDIGGRLELNYQKDAVYHRYLMDSPPSVGKQHLSINSALITLCNHLDRSFNWRYYSCLINTILKVAEINDYDIYSAMEEKREFNKTRPDHQRENRQGEVGQKKF